MEIDIASLWPSALHQLFFLLRVAMRRAFLRQRVGVKLGARHRVHVILDLDGLPNQPVEQRGDLQSEGDGQASETSAHCVKRKRQQYVQDDKPL